LENNWYGNSQVHQVKIYNLLDIIVIYRNPIYMSFYLFIYLFFFSRDYLFLKLYLHILEMHTRMWLQVMLNIF